MRFRAWVMAASVLFAMGATCPEALAAQRGQRAPAPQGGARTPASAPGAPDLKTVLYDAADVLGMLRTAQEVDRIATMKFWAAGTMNVGGQESKVTNYVGSINFHVPGMRADITRTGADGKPVRQVEVVSGKFGWNETQPGMNGSPAPGMANARLLQIWMLPQGVVKAATAAGANTKVTREGGATVLTFPVASVGATIKATLDAKNMITDVEGRMGNVVINTAYADYGDWNGDDYLSDVMFPRHIVQKQGGVTVLDLTVTKTNTYNPYVVMPVPQNIQQAEENTQPSAR